MQYSQQKVQGSIREAGREKEIGGNWEKENEEKGHEREGEGEGERQMRGRETERTRYIEKERRGETNI